MSDAPAESPSPAPEPAKPAPEVPAFESPRRQRASLRKRLRLALRSIVLVAGCTLTAFWIYTFYAIGEQANPKGDGMEWMAAFPMTLIFMLLTLPALIIGLFGRALIFGALVAAASAFVNVWVWREILAEFVG
jgi:hypothetical protein